MVEPSTSSGKAKWTRESIGDYWLLRQLGKGGYGDVYLGWDPKHNSGEGRHVAVKTFTVGLAPVELMEKSFNAECTAAGADEHPNVLTIEEGGYLPILRGGKTIKEMNEPVYYTVSHFAQNGEAFDFVQAGKGLKESMARLLFHQIIDGVEHIHKQGMAHRDLKLENFFLDEKCTIKIADFGLAKFFGGPDGAKLQTKMGTPTYMAPELYKAGSYEGPPVDMFAIGIVLFMLMTGQFPFFRAGDKYYGRFQTDTQPYMQQRKFNHLSEDLLDLCVGLTFSDPKVRYSIDQVRAHPWMQGEQCNPDDVLKEFKRVIPGAKTKWEQLNKDRQKYVGALGVNRGGEDPIKLPLAEETKEWEQLEMRQLEGPADLLNGFYTKMMPTFVMLGIWEHVARVYKSEDLEVGQDSSWTLTFSIANENEVDPDDEFAQECMSQETKIIAEAFKFTEDDEDEDEDEEEEDLSKREEIYIRFDIDGQENMGDRQMLEKFVQGVFADQSACMIDPQP